jgi:hypothetical protein
MKVKLSLALILGSIIVTSTMLSPGLVFSAIGNDTNTNTSNTGIKNSTSLSGNWSKAITEQNSDGKLNVQIIPFSNTSLKTVNGTLKVGSSLLPLTYKQTQNGIGILDGDTFLAPEVTPGGRIAIDKFINSKPWTNGIIPFVINSDIPDKQSILDAMAYVQSVTPIKFKPVTVNPNGVITDANYLRFLKAPASADSCYTFSGMLPTSSPIFKNLYLDGKYHGQPVVVASWCHKPSLVHELGHDLGLWHEQKRCDRDQYINLIWSNIKKDAWDQYSNICDPAKPTASPLSPWNYDYCSIMHYKQYSGFAVDQSKPVFDIKKPVVGCQEKDIGHTEVYSPTDIRGIRAIYSFAHNN